jgi:hydrogenase maturation factor
MCLAVPGKILDTVEIGSNRFGPGGVSAASRRGQISISFQPVKVGDYVLMYGGFAISTWRKKKPGLIEQLGTREVEEEWEVSRSASTRHRRQFQL